MAAAELRVGRLFVYPVKSARGFEVREWPVDERGLLLDRRFMVVDEAGRFVTQREEPRMALVEVAVELATPKRGVALAEGATVTLRAPAQRDCSFAAILGADAERTSVVVWNDTVLAKVAPAEVCAWWSAFLGRAVRLVEMPNDELRVADPAYAAPGTPVSFADGFPFLVVTSASAERVSEWVGEPVPVERFRPNVVVDGSGAFAEDTWARIRCGEVQFDLVKPCARCTITTVDPTTAARGKEPLASLARHRRRGNQVLFGENAVHRNQGVLRAGDAVTVLGTRAPMGA